MSKVGVIAGVGAGVLVLSGLAFAASDRTPGVSSALRNMPRPPEAFTPYQLIVNAANANSATSVERLTQALTDAVRGHPKTDAPWAVSLRETFDRCVSRAKQPDARVESVECHIGGCIFSVTTATAEGQEALRQTLMNDPTCAGGVEGHLTTRAVQKDGVMRAMHLYLAPLTRTHEGTR
jgi:hypothetical protein